MECTLEWKVLTANHMREKKNETWNKISFDVGDINLVAIITDLVHCHSGSCYEHIKHRYKVSER